MQPSGSERGYLWEHFRLFHTIDQHALRVDWHFHAFDKLVYFVSGCAEYTIESETVRLQPGDILLVARGQLHQMRTWAEVPYERYILYLDSAYAHALAEREGGLNACFVRARKTGQSLMRLRESERAAVLMLLERMSNERKENAPYSGVLSEALLSELLVFLCRCKPTLVTEGSAHGETDEKIALVMDYIQAHLGEKLSCDVLAAYLNMSRSSFQHRFRQCTGCPPHAYIRLKRLLYASELLGSGVPALTAGRTCGYTDHSAFCHAFTSQFGVSPSAFRTRSLPLAAEE